MARLPQPGGDSGNWGDILNDYLSQALKADGQLKDNAVTANVLAPNSVTNAALADDSANASIIADSSVALAKLSSTVQTSLSKADSALQSAPVTKVNDMTGDVILTKSDIGLGSVDNVSDGDKPISVATQTALDAKVSVVTGTNIVYARGSGGTDISVGFSSGTGASTIMYRTTGGVSSINTPTAATHITNKQYVDAADALLAPLASPALTGTPTAPTATAGTTTTQLATTAFVATAVATSVTSVSVSSNQGVTASVTNATTTPAITIGLGAIAPTSMTTTGTTQSLQHTATNGTLTTTLTSNNLQFNRTAASYIDQSGTGGTIVLRTRDTAGTADVNRMTFTSGNTSSIQITNASLNLADSVNIDLGTTTGSKIGTATTQKIGFFNATPIVQPAATTDLGTVLSNLGLRVSGTGYSLALSGSFASAGRVRSASASTTTTATLTTGSVEYQLCNATAGAYTITLPTTTTAGYRFTIKKVDSSANAVTIAGTIDGATNYTLATQYKYVTLISTTASGSWFIVGGN